MRLKSTRASRVLGFYYVICLILIVFDLILLNLEGNLNSMVGVSVPFLLLGLIVYFRGHPRFEYDSDGEVLNITTEDPNFKWLGALGINHVEFPKRKLQSFRIARHFIKRTLKIQIKSKEGFTRKRSFDISFLSKQEVKDLKHSLNKVIHQNKKNK